MSGHQPFTAAALACWLASGALTFARTANGLDAVASGPGPTAFRAGLRSSPYGPRNGFPGAPYWLGAARSMASRFAHAAPALVWIVGTMEGRPSADGGKNFSGRMRLSFPAPRGAAFANIVFSGRDANEAYLDEFDRSGVQVWLQVEPADADVGTVIDLVLARYAGHRCVIGFGIDVEWHRWSRRNRSGAAVSDAQAEAWSRRVRAFNPGYRLFMKHWLRSKLPPRYRRDLVFINDSQRFASLAQMQRDFRKWGKAFFPAAVGFQFGYPADRAWWRQLDDPAQDIGRALLSAIPNTSDLIWVDFTMEEIWARAGAGEMGKIAP
jgi:hypothetical protein